MPSAPAPVPSMHDQAEVIAFLSSPTSYGLTEPVLRHQTHGAIVFLAGDRAYKLKRAVRFPYMDYSTADRRRAMCERELAVNRRTAPELYLEVRAVVRTPDGTLRFGRGNTTEAIDWLVVMKRFDQSALLEQLRRRGELDLPTVVALAETVASFHKLAEIDPRHGGARGIAEVIGEDALLFRTAAGASFDPRKLDRLARLAWRALDEQGALLDRRRQVGFVRRCHGDLHLNNICLIHGQPVLFDAIEFSDDFSSIDTLYDLAFLLMDLDRHALRRHANAVLNRYLEMTADYGGLAALPLFLSCRAAVRSHVTVAGAQARGEAGGASVDEAEQLLDHAIGYLEVSSPRLIAIGGLSGTGKSTLARLLAPGLDGAPGAIVLRSDVIRKRLLGVPDSERLPPAAYAPEVSGRVFGHIAEIAGQVLAGRYSVVVDAVYGQEQQRQQIESVARGADAPFHGLWLTAAHPLLEQRIAARQHDASDATVDVLRQQVKQVQAPASWTQIDASGEPDAIASHARKLL